MEIISSIFEFFKRSVPLWIVILVGLPIALAVQFSFNGRKARSRGFLPPILWVMLTVTVLFFLSNKSGIGGGPGGQGITNLGTNTSNQQQSTSEGNPVNNHVVPTPISLIVKRQEDGKFTIEDKTKQYNKVDIKDPVSELNTMEQLGYSIEHIDTYKMSPDNQVKKKYPKITTTHTTHN